MARASSVLLACVAACRLLPALAAESSGSGAAASVAAEALGDAAALDDATSLVQVSSQHVGAARRGAAGPPPELSGADAGGTEASQRQTAADAMLREMQPFVRGGFWARNERLVEPGCGKATFHDLGMSINLWKQLHPGVDGFCYFSNYAGWFSGAGSITDYKEYGRTGYNMTSAASFLCDVFAEGTGPARDVSFRRGSLAWSHMDGCIAAVDDPYCHSLGWLKGQRLDGTNMSDIAAWQAKGKEECKRIQDTYNFIDEEVTVGRHIFSTPVYLQKSLTAALGQGPPLDRRMYNEHAYTKCQLGDALGEMAYCYYRGCVLADGTISHGKKDCNYD